MGIRVYVSVCYRYPSLSGTFIHEKPRVADLNGIWHDGNKIIQNNIYPFVGCDAPHRTNAQTEPHTISLSLIRFCIFYWIILLQFCPNRDCLLSCASPKFTLFALSRASHPRIKRVHISNLYARFFFCFLRLFVFHSAHTLNGARPTMDSVRKRKRSLASLIFEWCRSVACWCLLDHPSNKISFRRESF